MVTFIVYKKKYKLNAHKTHYQSTTTYIFVWKLLLFIFRKKWQ